MAGIVAGSVAGWSPIGRRSEDGSSMRFSQSDGRSQLDGQEGTEVHPTTSTHDLVPSENQRLQPGHMQAEQASEISHGSGPSSLAPPQRAY